MSWRRARWDFHCHKECYHFWSQFYLFPNYKTITLIHRYLPTNCFKIHLSPQFDWQAILRLGSLWGWDTRIITLLVITLTRKWKRKSLQEVSSNLNKRPMTTVNNSHISLQDLLLVSSICPYDKIIEFGNDSLRNQNVIFKESIRRPLLVTFYGFSTEGSSGGSELNLIFRNCSVNLVSLFPHSIIVLCWQMGRISSPRNTPPLNIECVIIRYQCSISQKQQWWQQQDPSWRWERNMYDDEGNIYRPE